jgi:hypothetical protein
VIWGFYLLWMYQKATAKFTMTRTNVAGNRWPQRISLVLGGDGGDYGRRRRTDEGD